jgi:hypothetical protein
VRRRRCFRSGGVGELRADELAGEPVELPIDEVTNEELELGPTLLDGGGDDLRELHGRSVRPRR